MKKEFSIIIMVFTLLLIFFLLNLVIPFIMKGIEKEDKIVLKYGSQIYDEFNRSEFVPVIVRLKDSSNITLTGTKEERIVLLKRRNDWFNVAIDKVLATLPNNELKNVRKHFEEFSAEITNKGFIILINNTNVSEIIWSDIPPPYITK